MTMRLASLLILPLSGCGYINGSIRGPDFSSRSVDFSIAGLPTGVRKETSFTATPVTQTYSAYAYKFGLAAGLDCGDLNGYTIMNDLSASAIDISAFADGLVAVCASGVTAGQLDATSITRASWTKDTTGPLLLLTLTPTINSLNVASYSLSGTCTENGRSVAIMIGTVATSATCSALGFSLTGIDVAGAGSDGTIAISAEQSDSAGNASSVSTNVIKELIAPSAPGSFVDGRLLYSSATTPLFTWTAAIDASANFSHYEIAIGTTSGGTDVMSWLNIGNILSYQASGLTLSGATRYFASVRAVDTAGNITSTAGDGWASLGATKVVDTIDPAIRTHAASAAMGSQLALSEDGLTMVVGAEGDDLDELGQNAMDSVGAVFVYVRSGSSWVLQQKLAAEGVNARGVGDKFGRSVAISGNTIVVGAPYHNYDETGANSLNDAGAAFVYVRSGATWSLEQKIVAVGTNGRLANDEFGRGVAIAGDTIVVGAPGQDWNVAGDSFFMDSGAAYVFSRSGATWSLQQKIVGEGGLNAWVSGDKFGETVAISGETIVVGAAWHDYDANGLNAAARAGAAFVYTRSGTTWSAQQRLVGVGVNGRKTDDFFGGTVAISGDTIAIGSARQDYDAAGGGVGTDTGAAFIFTRSGTTWSLQQKIVAEGLNARVDYSAFGGSVAISGDTVVIGSGTHSYDENGANLVSGAGAAFVYTRSGTTWSVQSKLVGQGLNGRMQSDGFGRVAIVGDRIAIAAVGQDFDSSGANSVASAGASYLYSRSGGVWTLEAKIVDETDPAPRMASATVQMGSAIALSEDGLTMVVGAPKDNLDADGGNYQSSAGAAFVYVRSGTTWSLQQKLVGEGLNGRVSGDQFGTSVAISGNTVVVGAPFQSYDSVGANSVAFAGAAYVYTRSGATWTLQQKLVGEGVNGRVSSDQFGTAVAISGDTAVVGAQFQDWDAAGANSVNGAGSAYVFTRSGATWAIQQKLAGFGVNGRIMADNYGTAVAISGETIAIGSAQHDYDTDGANALGNAGAVFVYTRSGTTWNPQQKLVGSGVNGRVTADRFGSSLAILGETLVVGAPDQDYDAAGASSLGAAGAAFVFARSGTTWSLQQKLVGEGLNGRVVNDRFGSAVSIADNVILVGAYQQDYDADGANSVTDAGAAFLYTRSGTTWSLVQKLVGTGADGRVASDNFGISVAVGGDTLASGATGQDTDGAGANLSTDSGAVFIFSD